VLFSECVSIIKDGALAASAITGAVIAVKGLSTWRTQLKGKSEYELSRRILVSLFRYRDAIADVRHPMMWANEMPAPPDDEARQMSREKIRWYGVSSAYQKRWEKVKEQRTALYADLLEAEALWGSLLKAPFDKVFALQHELMINIRNYLELMDPDTPLVTRAAVEKKIMRKGRDIRCDNLEDEGDEFKDDLLAAMGEIEKLLKSKLSHDGI
jgi:hypothetical protein